MRIGFIGAGNMVSAIVRGAVAAGTPAGHLLLTSKHGSAERLAGQVGAVHVPDAAELVSRSDVLILGLKPYVIPDVLPRLSEAIGRSRPLVVSIAAGLTLERLESMLPDGVRVVRTMPNMAAAVGESMTALAPGSSASASDLETVRTLMESIGRTVILEEKDFSSFIGLAGSSPALVCAFIDALARAASWAASPRPWPSRSWLRRCWGPPVRCRPRLSAPRREAMAALRPTSSTRSAPPAARRWRAWWPWNGPVSPTPSCAPSRPSPSATGSWAPELRRDPPRCRTPPQAQRAQHDLFLRPDTIKRLSTTLS